MKSLISCGWFSAAVLALALAGCAKEPELEAVQHPHTLPQLQPLLYPGLVRPYNTGERSGEATGPNGRTLTYRLVYPLQTNATVPIIIFSHGNWSDQFQYDALVQHWASQGYLVASVNHLDCCGMARGIWNSLVHGQLGLIDARVQDLTWLLDARDFLTQQLPQLAEQLDFERVAAVGHSFGAFSAQQFGGAGVFNPDTEQYQYSPDARVRAIVAISPPGPMFDVITAQSWQQLKRPHLLATGTWDVNAQFWPDWRSHKLAFDSAVAGENYALITEGVDHYYGNLICRLERDLAPQTAGMALLQSVSTAFLDHYLRADNNARLWLENQTLATQTQGFTQLLQR